MKPILNLFWQICLLRQSPAYVPTYGWFVALVIVANVVCSTLVSLGVNDLDVMETLTLVLVGQTTVAALIMFALSFKNLAQRFVTTVTAVFGCELLITASLGLLLPVLAPLGDAAIGVGLVAYMIWSVTVSGFILHQALQTQLAIGIGVAMGIAIMSVIMGQVATGQ